MLWEPEWSHGANALLEEQQRKETPEGNLGQKALISSSFWPHYAACGAFFPWLGIKPLPLCWKFGILTTALPGKSQEALIFFFIYFFIFFKLSFLNLWKWVQGSLTLREGNQGRKTSKPKRFSASNTLGLWKRRKGVWTPVSRKVVLKSWPLLIHYETEMSPWTFSCQPDTKSYTNGIINNPLRKSCWEHKSRCVSGKEQRRVKLEMKLPTEMLSLLESVCCYNYAYTGQSPSHAWVLFPEQS